MRVVNARSQDVPAWLVLAAEVEPCFGPLVADAGFRNALGKNIARGTAFCVREQDGPPGSPLMGDLLLSPNALKYEIAWLAVAARWRRQGVGRALLQYALAKITPPAEVALITFAPQERVGIAARALYESFGFRAGELGPPNPGGIATQVFHKVLGETPTVRAVITRDDTVLLVQHHYTNPAHWGKWSLPGGHIDASDQRKEDALRRELYEELRLRVQVERAVGLFADRTRLHYVYRATPGGAQLSPDPDEIAGAAWWSLDDVDMLNRAGKLLAPFIYDAIQKAHAPQLPLL